ncbi:ester cyclase [Amycolatopsis pretoriensis]|uniref:ester cyclase n=1 Tax=Amycolatopsis pretoriensis TaxID=218821 RepID=UPI000A39403A
MGTFAHDPVVHNDRTLSLTAFQDLLKRDATEIPGLRYAVERLVVQGGQVACRIRFDCTPAADFRGLPTTGKRVSFVEHVFYRYDDGKIAEIWSLVDTEAIREQLTP